MKIFKNQSKTAFFDEFFVLFKPIQKTLFLNKKYFCLLFTVILYHKNSYLYIVFVKFI